MFAFRSILLVSVISLAAGLGLIFLGSLMGYDEFRGGIKQQLMGYSVLSTDSSFDDRYLRSLFETGVFGADIVSESSQWVMLNTFDSIRMIPLDEYSSRVFPFDPRDDGYAGKLKNVFIEDEKRFMYFPVKTGTWNSSTLDSEFALHLGDIPFSVEYFGIGRPSYLFFIMYGAASFCVFIICVINRKKHSGILHIITLLPVLASLSFFGAAGIGSAALLLALFIQFMEPLKDFFTSGKNSNEKKSFFKRLILPYRYYYLILPVFIFAFIIIGIFFQLKLLFLLFVFIAAFFVLIFSFYMFSLREHAYAKVSGIHKRFTPVTIVRRMFPEYIFSFYMLPFTAAGLLTLFLLPFMPGSYLSETQFNIHVSEQDYFDHLEYQAGFSTRQLGTGAGIFPNFFFDSDGLPSIETGQNAPLIDYNDYPPFPLKQLMTFFDDVNSGAWTRPDSGYGEITEKLLLLALLLFALPGLIIRNNRHHASKIDTKGFEKFSGILRFRGINWNKTLLYNNKSYNQLRKDA